MEPQLVLVTDCRVCSGSIGDVSVEGICEDCWEVMGSEPLFI